jgi:hypothetical protein
MTWLSFNQQVMGTAKAMGLLVQEASRGREIWARVIGEQSTTVYVHYTPMTKLGSIFRDKDTIRLFLDFHSLDPRESELPSLQSVDSAVKEVEQVEGATADILLSLGSFVVSDSLSFPSSRDSEPFDDQRSKGRRQGERSWSEFNAWYRKLLEENAKPGSKEVLQWVEANGERVWGPNNNPSKQAIRDHVSGVRPLHGPNSVKAHFKKMRSRNRVTSEKNGSESEP